MVTPSPTSPCPARHRPRPLLPLLSLAPDADPGPHPPHVNYLRTIQRSIRQYDGPSSSRPSTLSMPSSETLNTPLPRTAAMHGCTDAGIPNASSCASSTSLTNAMSGATSRPPPLRGLLLMLTIANVDSLGSGPGASSGQRKSGDGVGITVWHRPTRERETRQTIFKRSLMRRRKAALSP